MNRELWIKKALEAGFESFEIYQDVEEEKKYTWYKGEMDSFVTSHVTGTALRGIYKGKLANYATEDNSDEQMDRVLALMKEQTMAVTSDDEVFIREPEKTVEEDNPHVFTVPSADEVKELLSDLEKRILAYDKRVISVNEVEWEEIVSKREILNSKGLSVSDKSRIHVLIAECAVMEN
jgi:PmbA protein